LVVVPDVLPLTVILTPIRGSREEASVMVPETVVWADNIDDHVAPAKRSHFNVPDIFIICFVY
jgi:hypothetical protein